MDIWILFFYQYFGYIADYDNIVGTREKYLYTHTINNLDIWILFFYQYFGYTVDYYNTVGLREKYQYTQTIDSVDMWILFFYQCCNKKSTEFSVTTATKISAPMANDADK